MATLEVLFLVVAVLFGAASLTLICIWRDQLWELSRRDEENAIHARAWHERIWDETDNEQRG